MPLATSLYHEHDQHYCHQSWTKITTTTTDATQSDWTTFCNQFGLPTTGLTVAYPQGQRVVSTDWALEIALDIEWAHAIAPGANILLVNAYDNSNSNLLSAVDYAVDARSHGRFDELGRLGICGPS